MKKGMYILGAAAFVAGAYQLKKRKRLKDVKKKYHFREEIPDKDYVFLPKLICNPNGFKLFNKITSRGTGIYKRGVQRTSLQIKSFDNEKISIYIYEPEQSEKEVLPCLVYYHGGGFYGDYQDSYHEIMANYALLCRCKVVAVRYRPLTCATFRTSLKDCYQGLLWVYNNSDNLSIDKTRIAVGGDSAGGTFAAAVSHCVREWGGPKICYQMLLYPATDVSMTSESMKKYTDTPGWNSTYEKLMFQYITPALDDEMRPYLSLVEQKDYTGLCNAYVEVEEYDCLHDDGKNYADILLENGYEVYYNEVLGTFHAFDQDQNLNISKEIMKIRSKCLREAFAAE